MPYSTPHDAREFLFGSALGICHDYILRAQRRPIRDKKSLLQATREIDLCARLGAYFGTTSHLAAQGTTAPDLEVDGPTIRAEVKYFSGPARSWRLPSIVKDWNWLLAATNAGDEFKKRAWVVFWPSTKLFDFTNCLSVTRTHGTRYSLLDFAPFTPYAMPKLPKTGRNQQLEFKLPKRSTILIMPAGKKVRVDIVAYTTDAMWCAIYTRVTDTAGLPTIDVTDVPIDVARE